MSQEFVGFKEAKRDTGRIEFFLEKTGSYLGRFVDLNLITSSNHLLKNVSKPQRNFPVVLIDFGRGFHARVGVMGTVCTLAA